VGLVLARQVGRVTLLATAAALAACAGPLKQVASKVEGVYQAAFLDPAALAHQPIAVLLTSSPPDLSQWRQSASDALIRVLRAERPKQQVLPWEETVSRINGAGLTQPYAEMVRTYELTGVLEKASLQRIGAALGTRYLAQPTLIAFRQGGNVRLSFLGLRIAETREATARGRLQIWDTEGAQIVWAIEGEATLAGEEIRSRPISFEVMEFVWRDLLRSLPAEPDAMRSSPVLRFSSVD
jgi:hypothetical protein